MRDCPQGCSGKKAGHDNAENSPREECDLAPLAPVVLLKVEVVYSPSALLLGQVPEELIVCAAQTALLLDDDLCVVLREREDDVFRLLPELQLLVRFETLGVHADAGGLRATGPVCVSMAQRR